MCICLKQWNAYSALPNGELSAVSRRLYFFLFQKKLYILFSISFLIFWNSINLAYVSRPGNEDLVCDYIFTSQKDSYSVPGMGFMLTFNYFVSFEVMENSFTKMNFKYFNGNCDHSSWPRWWVLFLYTPPHKSLAFWKDYLWTSLSFSYRLKITCILLRLVISHKKTVGIVSKIYYFNLMVSYLPSFNLFYQH